MNPMNNEHQMNVNEKEEQMMIPAKNMYIWNA